MSAGNSSAQATLPAILAGYSGTFSIPATVSGSGSMTITLSTTPPTGVAVISASARKVASTTRRSATVGRPLTIGVALTPLVYVSLTPSATISFAASPTMTIGLPADLSLAGGAATYVGYFDPNAGIGWTNLLGPGQITGSNDQFLAASVTMTLNANTTYVFGLYSTQAQPSGPLPPALQLTIPTNAANASATSYVSPATTSVTVTFTGQATQTFPVGSGIPGCTTGSSSVNCQFTVQVPSTPSAPRVVAYSSTNGSGTPLAIGTTVASETSSAFSPQWTPVLSAMTSSVTGTFAAGAASSVPFALAFADSAGDAIPAGTASFVDASGAPITIGLADSDTTGETSLGTTTYSGNHVLLAYNGNLPLATGITVTATATAASSTVARASSTLTSPTASQNFTFSLGSYSQTPQSSVIPSWTYIPDGKISIVNENGTYRFFWPEGGGGAAPTGVLSSTGTGPRPEQQTGSASSVYSPSQEFEANGAWFMNVFPINAPYAPTDTQDLVAIYHAESNDYVYYNKATAISYSTNGGTSWSTGNVAIAAYDFPNMLTPGVDGFAQNGDDAGDVAAIYDPVNNRWVAFYTASDLCSETGPVIEGGLTIAISSDARASAGTWYKYQNGGFTSAGVGGCETPIPNFSGIGFTSNADVSWNSYLNEWVMLFNASNPNTSIYLSTSTDLSTWTTPQLVTSGTDIIAGTGTAAYPTLIGPNDEKVTGQASTLYYAVRDSSNANQGPRVMYERTLNFHRND